LYPLQNRTFGQANDSGANGPRIGPLVISELMYHPNVGAGQNPDDYEYIEICNPTAAEVDLSHWQISNGVDFVIPAGTTIGAYEAMLVLSFDPSDPLNDIKRANFKSKYNIGSSIKLVGGFNGHLANEGETVQLLDADGVLEDELRYTDVAPWPTAADGGGDSLQRVSAAAWGDDAASWIAAAPTPGTAHVSALVGRNIFYNNSKFDAHTGYTSGDPAINDYDDGAIATDKTALMSGQTATFANYTSYSRGINGIMVDILDPENPGGINAADFQFKVGNGGSWTTAPAPSSVLVRQGKGAGGSDRVTITWDDNVIQNQWLQVTVLADANTGLLTPYVFYFGNAIGESGNSPANAVVDPQDETASRTHKTGFTAAAITNPYDYNRDGRVNATDDLIARNNKTDGSVANPPLQLITLSPAVVSRYVFYNDSRFDGHTGYIDGDPAPNIYDDNAIAIDKQALLPGQTATFANFTSFSRGITGIIVDIRYPENPGGITAADFQFKVGNGGIWTTAPAPRYVLERQGNGAGNSDRVTITWDDNVIQNQWLQVTFLADANTGLSAADVFYFGNAIGESGDNSANAMVDPQDETASRTHKTGFSAAAIDNHYDYNRDGRVNSTDDLIARNNRTDGAGGTPLQLIAAPVGAPLSADDTLQPLSAVADIAITQPATATTDMADSQPVTLPAAVNVVTSQPAALLEDNRIIQPEYAKAEIAITQTEIAPATMEIAPALPAFSPVQTAFLPVPLLACPAVLNFVSFPRPSMAAQFPGVLHPQDMGENSNLLSASHDAVASDQWVTPPEHGNHMFMLGRGSQTSRTALSQGRLHDAVFEGSFARFSITEEDNMLDDSSVPADAKAFLDDCLPAKSDKSFVHAIDTFFAVSPHNKE
jgi:hypothetical protein